MKETSSIILRTTLREYNATVTNANKNNTFILYNYDYNKICNFIQDNQFSKITLDPTDKLKNSTAVSPSLLNTIL